MSQGVVERTRASRRPTMAGTKRRYSAYSDSEEDEDQAPHYEHVKNYTKHPPAWFKQQGMECVDNVIKPDHSAFRAIKSSSSSCCDSSMDLHQAVQADPKDPQDQGRDSEDEDGFFFFESKRWTLPVKNPTPDDLRIQMLEDDAHEIHRSMPMPKEKTAICVTVRRVRDGAVKKFVFTNNCAYYVEKNEGNEYAAFFRTAHSLGYHVVQAQHSHAEAQLLQFLQERTNTYEGIPLAIGWSRPACPTCWDLLEAVWGPQQFSNKDGRFRNAVRDGRKTRNWFTPAALIGFVTYSPGTEEFRRRQGLQTPSYWEGNSSYGHGCESWTPGGPQEVTACSRHIMYGLFDCAVKHDWHEARMKKKDSTTGQ